MLKPSQVHTHFLLLCAVLLLVTIVCLEPPAAAAQTQVPPEQLQAITTLTKSLSTQAAIYCAPLVAMYNLRYSVSFAPTAKSKPGEIWRFAEIATPTVAQQSGYVSPNVNVLYGFGFVDLRPEPVILTVPDSHGRYYIVEIVDMWTNSFAYPVGAATAIAAEDSPWSARVGTELFRPA